MRPLIANWEEVAGDMIRRMHQEVAWVPSDEKLKALLAEVLAYPGIPPHWQTRELEVTTTPLLTVIFRKADLGFRFFSMWTTFGTPQDIALEELRIECSFPADAATVSMP
jgi:transcription regulator MmyB-like protein